MICRIIGTAPLTQIAGGIVATPALAHMVCRIVGAASRHGAACGQRCSTDGNGCYAQFPDISHNVSPEWTRRGMPVFPQRKRNGIIPKRSIKSGYSFQVDEIACFSF
jgi:hypothetical protein